MSLEHLIEHESEEVSETTLEALTAYAEALVVKREELEELEALVKEKKAEVNKLEQELLPEAMISLGMASFELSSGKKIAVKEELSCSVKNYEKLYDFLEQRGDDALMKTSIEVGKLPQNILNNVLRDLKETYDLDGAPKLYIHPSTLKAYFKRLCAVGTENNAEVPLAAIDDEMISTYTYYKVSVKNK